MIRMAERMALLGLVLLLAIGGRAQEKPKEVLTPLKLQVVFSEYDGERKVSSIPYTLLLTARNDRPGDRSRIRVGVSVPVKVSASEFHYQDVGADIDAGGQSLEGGQYKIDVIVHRSQIYSPGEKQSAEGPGNPLSLQPILREFRAQYDLLMKDGQMIQSVLATDPVSGRVMKVDVTLTVVK